MKGLGYNCKNCNNKFSGNYCNMCGEKIYTMHDKSISHFFKEGLHFFDHMVFAVEINAFYLLWGFIVLPVLLVIVNNITKWLTGNYVIISDNELGILIYSVICLYFFLAAKRFYGLKWWWCILPTGIFLLHIPL
jgi:hypothetical protein